MKLASNKKVSKDMPPRGIFKRFRRDEDGALIIFSLMMMVMILWFGGMAVDLMRYETTRAKLQGSLDRATLAAADLDQIMPPADVVRDYMDKAGMLSFLQGNPTVSQGINYRVVTADASAPMPLFFYDLPRIFSSPFSPGMTALNVSGSSTAEERVTDVEVSLILDVSSSMNSNNRMTNLRPAAREFVSTVLANNTNAPQGLITISMIPYSAVVNPGSQILPFLTNINRTQNYSTCPLFDDAVFNSTDLDLGASLDQVSHFDQGWWYDNPNINAETIDAPWCYEGELNAIRVHTTSEADLHTAIDELEAFGNTAIDMGVKWGVALLDPSTNAIVSNLANTAGNGTPSIASSRPEAFGQPDVLKVVVLMTDGQNTQQRDLIEPYKSELSRVWFNYDPATESLGDVPRQRVSVQYDGWNTPNDFTDDEFFRNVNSESEYYRSYPIGYSSNAEYVAARQAMQTFVPTAGQGVQYTDDVYNASWQNLFAYATTGYVNNKWLSRAYNDGAIPWSTSWYNAPNYGGSDNAVDYNVVNGGEANTRLSSICAAARAQGIVIYTVAFEAPSGGQSALQDCASSPSHYFDVDGSDITAAFSAIASDIRNLKLTQ